MKRNSTAETRNGCEREGKATVLYVVLIAAALLGVVYVGVRGPSEVLGVNAVHPAKTPAPRIQPAEVAPKRTDVAEPVKPGTAPARELTRVDSLLSMLCPDDARERALTAVDEGRRQMGSLRQMRNDCVAKQNSVLVDAGPTTGNTVE